MQAIILAAGMGKRLKGLTADVTKCMVKVNGVTLIERMLTQLDRLALSRIVMVVGYEAEKLITYLNTLDVATPIEYVENPIYDTTNNIYSLYLAREQMREQDTLLLESDLIFDDRVLDALLDDQYPSLALVAQYESWMDGSVVTLREDDVIDDFLGKNQFRFEDIRSYYKTVNIYKFSQSFSDHSYVPFLEAYCQALGHNEYYEQVLKVITKLDKAEIKAKVLKAGNWYEIDDLQDLDIAESIFEPNEDNRFERVRQRYGGYWRYPHLLSFVNPVNPFFPPQKLINEIKANFEELVTNYPSNQYVNSLLAGKIFGISTEMIAAGNGAPEIIKSVLGLISGKVGMVLPTYEEYPNRRRGDLVAFKPGNEEYSYSADDLMDFFNDKPIESLVVINPDNTSGNYIPRDDVLRLVKWAEGKAVKLILDESSVEFADINGALLDDDILVEHQNLIVIKSISRTHGVPGLRLGVAACGTVEFMDALRKDISIWNINSIAEFYLQIYEKYKKDLAKALELFYPVREDFYTALKSIPYLIPIPGKANYITCKLIDGYTAQEVAKYVFIHNNILIRDLSGKYEIEGEYIRVAVKTPEENMRLIEALSSFK